MEMPSWLGPLALAALTACGDPAPADAGADGGADGGLDAGIDAGLDAGTDGGFDAAGRPVLGIGFEPIALPPEVVLPTASAFLPDGTMLVAAHDGVVHHLAIEGDAARLLGGFSIADDDFLQSGDCGLLQIEVDPRWSENHFLWLGHCGAAAETVIRRVTFDGATYDGVVDTSAEILRVWQRLNAANHSIGQIGFEEDGVTMWAFLGDKASAEGQRTNLLLAVLVRIVPSRDPEGRGYVPAVGNPFDGTTLDRPETYAWGLRYGWRATRDRLGRIWVGDVGETEAEEIDLVTGPGQNFGWSACEGPCDPPRPEMIDPLLYWRRSDTSHPYYADDPDTRPSFRRVAWVGEVYRPDASDRYRGFLDDRVPFGDICLGWVRGAWADETGAVVYDEPWGHLPHLTSWEQAPDGWVYATVFGSCDALDLFDEAGLYRVVPRFR